MNNEQEYPSPRDQPPDCVVIVLGAEKYLKWDVGVFPCGALGGDCVFLKERFLW